MHYIDALLIIYPIIKKLNKRVHFIAKPSWWFLGDSICRKCAGCIPLFTPRQAYNDAKKLLKKKEIVGIFPEGGINTKKFKTGVVRLSLDTNTPILPIKIKSSYIPFNSELIIGKPLKLSGKNIKLLTIKLMKLIKTKS